MYTKLSTPTPRSRILKGKKDIQLHGSASYKVLSLLILKIVFLQQLYNRNDYYCRMNLKMYLYFLLMYVKSYLLRHSLDCLSGRNSKKYHVTVATTPVKEE